MADAKPKTFDMTKCADCGAELEKHPEGGMGYVSPESTEVTEQGPQGMQVKIAQKPVCAKCYKVAFEKVYPGQQCPIK